MLKFEINDTVTITASNENGLVVGRAEYAHSESSYLIRYKRNDGTAVEAWWNESAIFKGVQS